MSVPFEWDAQKRALNLRKHGIDFADASRVFDGGVLEGFDERGSHDEARIITYGEVNHQVLAVVYTWRGKNRRIISARKATKAEREAYYRALYPG